MAKKYDLVHGEKYTMNGEEKTKWTNIGFLNIKDDGKINMKINYIPVDFDGWVSAFEKKPYQPKTGMASPVEVQQVPQGQQSFGEEQVPF